MKIERCLIKKITKRIMEVFVFPIIMLIGLTFIMGFYYERNVYVKLNDITLELGDKLPDEIINYISFCFQKHCLVCNFVFPFIERAF